MNALIESFESKVRSSTLRISRSVGENVSTVVIEGQNGFAEMDFYADGRIEGTIDAEMIHTWKALPNGDDMASSARKIRSIIG